jgi:hypothetical protein
MSLKKGRTKVLPEWDDPNDISAPTHSRSSRVLGVGAKFPKGASTKSRQQIPKPAPPKPDPALMREPGTTVAPKERHSQGASWDHLRKLEFLQAVRPSNSRGAPASPRVDGAPRLRTSGPRAKPRPSGPAKSR